MDRETRKRAALYTATVSNNPHVVARFIARRLGIGWQSVSELADAMEASQEALAYLLSEPTLLELEYGLERARDVFAQCGSPIEELFLAHAIAFAHDTFAWDAEIGRWENEKIEIRQQVTIESFRVDFTFTLAGSVGTVVELDGHEFHERSKRQAERDKSRDRRLQELGWKVLRFTGSEVWRAPEEAVTDVFRVLTGGKPYPRGGP